VDLSEAMITYATVAAADAQGAERLRFQVADVTALPFDDGSVDLVVSSLSQHHWDDPAGGLRDIVRVLRSGGQAWIYDFRFALRDPETLTRGLSAEVSWERPAAGSYWFSPISRLVLRRS
jgi:ubiquinone/menaquinone biosynthesis C-methylase UbiE